MRSQISSYKILIILLLVVFTAISVLGCFAMWGRYLVDYDLNAAGDTFFEGTRSNSFAVILICSVIQVGTLFSSKKALRIVSVMVAGLSALLTIFYVPLCNAADSIMGGIVSYYYKVTWLGYIAMFISVVIFILQIYSLKKQG